MLNWQDDQSPAQFVNCISVIELRGKWLQRSKE